MDARFLGALAVSNDRPSGHAPRWTLHGGRSGQRASDAAAAYMRLRTCGCVHAATSAKRLTHGMRWNHLKTTMTCIAAWLLCAASGSAQTAAPSPIGNSSQDFGGIRTFLRAPHVRDLANLNADIAVLGVPLDQATSNRPGQRYGPRDIREASLIYAWAPAEGFYYIDTEQTVLKGVRWADLGDRGCHPCQHVSDIA